MDFDDPTSSSRDEKPPPPVKSMKDVPSSSKSSSGRICRVGMLPEDELRELEEVLTNSTRQEGKELKLNMYDRQRHSMKMLSNRLVVEVDMKAIIPNMSCDICHDVIKGSVMTKKCGHRFCDQCIMLCIMRAGSSCPTCRHALGSKRELKPDPRFDNFIAQLVDTRSDVARFMAKHNIETEGYPDERYRRFSELEEDSDEDEEDEEESDEDEEEEDEEEEEVVESGSENEQESESESVENEEEVEDEEQEDEEEAAQSGEEVEEEEESEGEGVSPEESENVEQESEDNQEQDEAGSSDDADDEEEKEDDNVAVEEEVGEEQVDEEHMEKEKQDVEMHENEVEQDEKTEEVDEEPEEMEHLERTWRDDEEHGEDNGLEASPEVEDQREEQKSTTYDGSSRETTPPENLIAINLEFLRIHNHPYPETDESTESSFEESEDSEESDDSEEEENQEKEEEEQENSDVEEGELVDDEDVSSGNEQDSDLTQLDSDDREYRISEYEFSGTDDSEWSDDEVIVLLNDASGVPSEVSDSSSDDYSSSEDEDEEEEEHQENDEAADKVEETMKEQENAPEALENISDEEEDEEESEEEEDEEEEEEEEEEDFDSDDYDSNESYPSVFYETIPADDDQPDHTKYLKALARVMTKERLEKLLEQECMYEKQRLEELMESDSDDAPVEEGEEEEGEPGEAEEVEIRLDENGFPIENLDGVPIENPERMSVDKSNKEGVIEENRSMSRSPFALQICEDEQPASSSTPSIPPVIEPLQIIPKPEPAPNDEPVIAPRKETPPEMVSNEPDTEINQQRETTPGTTEYEGEGESESDSEDVDDEDEGEEEESEAGDNEEEEKDSLDNSEISQTEFGPIENDDEDDDKLDSDELLYQQTVLMLERRQNTLPTADEVFNLLSKDYEIEKDLEVGQNIDDINLAQILSEPMPRLSDNEKFMMGKNYNMIEKLVVEVATRMKMQTVLDSEALEHPEMFMDADSYHQLFDSDYSIVNPNDRVEYNQEPCQPSTSSESVLFPQNLEQTEMPQIKQEMDISMISQDNAGSSFDQPDQLEKMDISQDVSQLEEKLEESGVDNDSSNPEQLEKMTEESMGAREEGECENDDEEEEDENDNEEEDFDDEEEESEEEESSDDDDEIFDENAETTSSSGSETDASVPDPSKEPLLEVPKFSDALMEKYRLFKKNKTKMLYKEKVKSIKMTTIRMRNVAYRPAKFAQPHLPHRSHPGPSSSERPRKMAKLSGNVKTPSKITAIPNVNQQYAHKYGQQQKQQQNQYLAMQQQQQQQHLLNQQRLQGMTPQQRSQEQVAEWLKSPEVIAQNASKSNDLYSQMYGSMQNNPYINPLNQQQQKIQLTPQQQHYQFQLQQLQRQHQQQGLQNPHMMMNQPPIHPGYPTPSQQTPNPYMMQPSYLGMPPQMYQQQTPQPQQYTPMQNQMMRNQMTPSMWNVQQQQQQQQLVQHQQQPQNLTHEQFMQQHQQRMNQITQAALDRQRLMMTQPGLGPSYPMSHLQPQQDSSFKKVKTEIQIEGTHSIELELYPTNGYRLKRRSIGGHADTVFCLSAGKSTFAHVARLLASRLPGHQGSQLGSFWAYKKEERMLRKFTLKQTLDDAVAMIGQAHLVIFYDDISMGDETNHDYIVNSEFLDSKKS